MSEKNVNIFLPINSVKSVAEAGFADSRVKNLDNVVIVSGWASTGDEDIKGDIVDTAEIDATYFIKHGWIDYEHDVDNVIGIPTENSFVDPNKGLYVEAALFKKSPEVQSLIQLVDNLQDIGSDRKLGFSIEGKAVRSESDPQVLHSLLIYGVAVTKNPANLEATWDVVRKSLASGAAFTAGYDINPATQIDGAALKPESLLGSLKNLSYALDNLDFDNLRAVSSQVARLLEDDKSASPSLKPLLLQVFAGLSRKAAIEQLKNGG